MIEAIAQDFVESNQPGRAKSIQVSRLETSRAKMHAKAAQARADLHRDLLAHRLEKLKSDIAKQGRRQMIAEPRIKLLEMGVEPVHQGLPHGQQIREGSRERIHVDHPP